MEEVCLVLWAPLHFEVFFFFSETELQPVRGSECRKAFKQERGTGATGSLSEDLIVECALTFYNSTSSLSGCSARKMTKKGGSSEETTRFPDNRSMHEIITTMHCSCLEERILHSSAFLFLFGNPPCLLTISFSFSPSFYTLPDQRKVSTWIKLSK